MDDRAEFETAVKALGEKWDISLQRAMSCGIEQDGYSYGLAQFGYLIWQAATARQRERDAQMVEEWKRLVSHTDYGAIPSKKSMLEVLIYVAACIRDSGKPAEAIRRQP